MNSAIAINDEGTDADSGLPSRSSLSIHANEGWLGGRDSNPNNVVQSHVSYR